MAGLGAIGNVGQLVATLGLNTMPFMKGMNDAQKKLAAVNMGFMMVGRTMTRFVTIPMALAGAAAVNTQKNFEASMTKIIGLVGVSRDVVEEWTKEVLKMASVTGRGPEELADALYFVTSAGIRGAEAMEVLEMAAKASAAGLGETKTVADLVTSAMNAYGKENLSAAMATDILVAAVREGKAEATELAGAMGFVLPIASEFGVTFDQVGAAFAGMTRTGTNARVAATQLKAILSTMASPSEATQKALARYSMSASDFRKTIREEGLIQALLDLRKATIGNEEALADIFPNIRALMGVLDLLGKNVEYNTQIFEALKNSAGSLERAFEEVQGTTQQKLNVAMATLKATLVSIGEAMKPLIVKWLARLNDRLTEMSKRWSTFTEQQSKFRINMLKITAAMGPFLVVLSRIITLIKSSLGPYIAAAAAIITLTMAIANYIRKHKSAAALARESAKASLEVEANAKKEAAAVYNVFQRLKNAEKGTKDWQRAKDEVVRKYGAYLDNLEEELSTTEKIAEATEKVARAKASEFKVKGYTDELERATDRYDKAISNAFERFDDAIVKGSNELLRESEGKLSETDYTFGLLELMEKGADQLAAGMSSGEIKQSMGESVKAFYAQFFHQLSTQPIKVGVAMADEFLEAYMKSISLQASKMEITADLQKKIDEELANMKLGDVALEIENIDAQIKGLEEMTGQMEETERIWTLIGLHKAKAARLDEAGKKAQMDIVAEYEKQLEAIRRARSSLGEEEQIKGRITDLEEARKKLSGKALEDNTKATREEQRKLAILQNETSGLNEVEKIRGRINMLLERAAELEGDAQEAVLSQARGAQFLADMLDAEAQGYNDIYKMQKFIAFLQESKTRASEEDAKMIQGVIDKTQKQIDMQQDLAAGYNYITREQNAINRAKENMNKLEGEDLIMQEEALHQRQMRLNAYQREHGALTEIGKLESAIADLELERLRIADPERAAALDAEITRKRIELAKLTGEDTFGIRVLEQFIRGSKGWFKEINKIIAKQREFRDKMKAMYGEESDEYKNADQSLKASLKTRYAAYADYATAVLSVASTMASGISNIIEMQKQKELSAVGDNAKARERIEKAYYEKQKKWAIAEALINTAGAAVAALKGPPIYKWIEFAAVLAAGALQVSAMKAQSFAEGGLVYDNTLAQVGDYPGARNNPEVIAPLNELKKYMQPTAAQGMPKEIILVAKGRDLRSVLKTQELLDNTY